MNFFKKETVSEETIENQEKETWKIIIADDEKDVHTLTKTVLKKFEYLGRKIEFINTYSGAETIDALRQNPDVVLILLDVVMETDTAGLDATKIIRDDLKNTSVQIVLRTGQAGQFPQYEVVRDYEINDYKEKTELTSTKLMVSVTTAIRAYNNLKHIEETKKEIELLNKEIIDTQKEVVFRLGSVAETRSKETGMHVKRVAGYSHLLALYYGLEKEDAELLKQASPMHDIGKIGIPDHILNKPGKLTPEEFEIMKTHSFLGYDMIKGSNKSILKVAAIVAHEHHEKWDGSGYPRRLKEKDINIYGRITAIADVFDALGSDRCYKKAWDDEKIFNLFKEQKGKQFEPKLIDIFFDNLSEFLKIRDTFRD